MIYAARFKAFLALSVVVLVAVSAAYLVRNPGKKVAPSPVKAVDVEQAEVVIDGFHFSKTEDDESTWELNAKRAEVRKDTGIAKLDELEAVFTGKGGDVLNLKAGKGVFDTETRALELSGGQGEITVTSSIGYEMRVKELSWDNSARELSTDDLVTIVGRDVKIEGRGMVAKADLQEVRIINGVKTVFFPSR